MLQHKPVSAKQHSDQATGKRQPIIGSAADPTNTVPQLNSNQPTLQPSEPTQHQKRIKRLTSEVHEEAARSCSVLRVMGL